jgi:tetratricopeptide (TPR) repeat protein
MCALGEETTEVCGAAYQGIGLQERRRGSSSPPNRCVLSWSPLTEPNGRPTDQGCDGAKGGTHTLLQARFGGQPRFVPHTLLMETTDEADWEGRLADLWGRLAELGQAGFVLAMRQLVAERSDGDPVALFELGAAYDSTGSPQEAADLYKLALQAGLAGLRRRRARIQMASSLRNLAQPQQAADMLFEELKHPSDELDQAVAGFLALALADLGREREALSFGLGALATYLPRYNRSLARYAQALIEPASPNA